MNKSRTSNERGRLLMFSAPSGAGKTSLTRALVPRLRERGHQAAISISYTTRAPRPGEQDGVHYHFVDESTFVSMIGRGEFLEHAHVFGRRYGTGRERTAALLGEGLDVFLDIDWQGAEQVKRLVPDAISIFILPPSRKELERRLRARGQDDEAVIVQRMAAAQAEMSHYPAYDFLVVNQDFESALAELETIVGDARLRQWSAKSLNLQRQVQAQRHRLMLADLLASPP